MHIYISSFAPIPAPSSILLDQLPRSPQFPLGIEVIYYSVYLLYWYKRTNTDAEAAGE